MVMCLYMVAMGLYWKCPLIYGDACLIYRGHCSSKTKRKNKGKQKWFHCAGTRSVADIHEEERVKGLQDLDRSDLFIKRHTRKDGKPTNETAKYVIEKLKSLESAQPLSDDSTAHQVAARNYTYTQVLGPDRPGRVIGVGTGPTPTSMWGNESKEALRSENRLLMQRITELETSMAEKFAKMVSYGPSMMLLGFDFMLTNIAGLHTLTIFSGFEKPYAIQQRGIVLELDVIQQAQSGMDMYDQVWIGETEDEQYTQEDGDDLKVFYKMKQNVVWRRKLWLAVISSSFGALASLHCVTGVSTSEEEIVRSDSEREE
ncbi:hypothetical protein Taro_023044 [Colocasia esculenta]|uniref:Uncharacterized protein n=1 Tax=Colocasia esculenta TaxID=4460 RepID=A0A843VDA2_COLES|nr:hypothetical protein [Colocasia esculenta]